MKCNVLITGILLHVFGYNAFAQQLYVNTSIENGAHNYAFYEGITDTSKITVIATNPYSIGGICEYREYDHSLNLIKRKPFIVENTYLAQTCGSGSSGVQLDNTCFFPSPTDSSIYVTTNLSHNYGSCAQVNGWVLIKYTDDYDPVWSRQYDMLSNGSIPMNDSTLLVYCLNGLFSVKFSNGDINWARWSSGYMSVEGALNGFNDTTIYVYGHGLMLNPLTGCGTICELSSSGNYTWCATLCDTTTNQYFIHGILTSDSCFVLLSLRNFNTPTAHIGMFKIDRLGNKIWEKVYTMTGYYGWPMGLVQTKDGGFLISHTALTSPTSTYPLLMKTDSLGNVEWNRIFPGTNVACQSTFLSKIKPLGNEKFLILGGNLIQTDSIGNGCFFTPFANINTNNGNSVIDIPLPYTTTVMPPAQYPEIEFNDFIDMISIENATMDSCLISTGVVEATELFSIQLFPNPAHDQVQIQLSERNTGPMNVLITDISGRLTYQTIIDANHAVIDCGTLQSGTYFLVLVKMNEAFACKKFTIVRD